VSWVVVLPAKGNPAGKSRLDALPERAALAAAFAVDTVSALLASPRVRRVFVVTGDPALAAELRLLGAVIVPETTDHAGVPTEDRLNAAIRQGVGAAQTAFPDDSLAIVTGDLPALRASVVTATLDLAAAHALSMVPDAAGTGTTALFTRPGRTPALHFGPGSRTAHEQAGCVPLDLPAASPMRRDVDTLEDLDVARGLGLGPCSRAVLREPVGPAPH